MSSLLTVLATLAVLSCFSAFEYDVFPKMQMRLLKQDPRSLGSMKAGGDVTNCKTACDGMPACKLFNHNRVKDKCWFKSVKKADHMDLVDHKDTIDIYQKIECDDVILTHDKKLHVSLANSSKLYHNVTTGSTVLQSVLECGEFTYDATPPFDVTWTLPDGTQVGSFDYLDGFFRFVLPRDGRQEGTYRCSVEAPAWAQSCLWDDSVDYNKLNSDWELTENYLVDQHEKKEKQHNETISKILENKANIQANSDKIDNCTCAFITENRAMLQLVAKDLEYLKLEVADL